MIGSEGGVQVDLHFHLEGGGTVGSEKRHWKVRLMWALNFHLRGVHFGVVWFWNLYRQVGGQNQTLPRYVQNCPRGVCQEQ